MSFFVSDALKGRVSEDDLIESDKTGLEQNKSDVLVVRANFKDKKHDFVFSSLSRQGFKYSLEIEIPESYEFLPDLINSNITFDVVSPGGKIASFSKVDSDWTLTKQNERNCYLLKIIIDA